MFRNIINKGMEVLEVINIMSYMENLIQIISWVAI